MTGLLLWIAFLFALGALLHLFDERLSAAASRHSAAERRGSLEGDRARR